jgi:hypothetical protein
MLWLTNVTRLCLIKRMKNQQKANIERQRKAMDLWLSRKAEIVALYAMGDQSQAQMAERYGVTLAGFQKALARLGIAPKSRGRAGSANGRFKDGAQSTAYRSMIEKDTEALGDYYRRIADQAVGSLKAGGMNSWLPFIDKYTHYVGRPSTLESLQVQLEAVFKKVEMLATRLEDSQQQTARVTDRLAKQSSWLPQLFQTHEAMLGQFNTAEEALHKLDKVLTLASKVAHTKMAATPPANPYQWTAEQRRAIIELAEQMQRGNFAVLPGKPGIQPDPNRKPDNDDPHFTYYSY